MNSNVINVGFNTIILIFIVCHFVRFNVAENHTVVSARCFVWNIDLWKSTFMRSQVDASIFRRDNEGKNPYRKGVFVLFNNWNITISNVFLIMLYKHGVTNALNNESFLPKLSLDNYYRKYVNFTCTTFNMQNSIFL